MLAHRFSAFSRLNIRSSPKEFRFIFPSGASGFQLFPMVLERFCNTCERVLTCRPHLLCFHFVGHFMCLILWMTYSLIFPFYCIILYSVIDPLLYAVINICAYIYFFLNYLRTICRCSISLIIISTRTFSYITTTTYHSQSLAFT